MAARQKPPSMSACHCPFNNNQFEKPDFEPIFSLVVLVALLQSPSVVYHIAHSQRIPENAIDWSKVKLSCPAAQLYDSR